MCVIAYKARDVRFPTEKNVEEMWKKNPDGAGVMWRRNANGPVKFRKGFMKLEELKRFLDNNRAELEKSEVALHFRITTHGGTCPKNCHPFVVGDDHHVMSGCAKRILMHNGILPFVPRRKDISDTGELAIRLGSFSSPRDALGSFNECLEGNRIILMDETGTHFFGDRFKESANKENAGILYSNLNHESFGFGSYGSLGASASWRSTWGEQCYYDRKDNVFRSAFTGKTVALDDVDPDCLSDADYDAWEAAWNEDAETRECARSLGMTVSEYRDLATEAESYGMSVDDYLRDVLGEEEWNWEDDDAPVAERSAS